MALLKLPSSPTPSSIQHSADYKLYNPPRRFDGPGSRGGELFIFVTKSTGRIFGQIVQNIPRSLEIICREITHPWQPFQPGINRCPPWYFCERSIVSRATRVHGDETRRSRRYVEPSATLLTANVLDTRHVIDRSCKLEASRNSYATAALALLPNETSWDNDFRS